jgi:hypothetical protein
MRRAAAYEVVVQELERWRCLAPDALITQAGAPPLIRGIEIDREPVSIAASASWRDESRTKVRVEVSANGPSRQAHRVRDSFGPRAQSMPQIWGGRVDPVRDSMAVGRK